MGNKEERIEKGSDQQKAKAATDGRRQQKAGKSHRHRKGSTKECVYTQVERPQWTSARQTAIPLRTTKLKNSKSTQMEHRRSKGQLNRRLRHLQQQRSRPWRRHRVTSRPHTPRKLRGATDARERYRSRAVSRQSRSGHGPLKPV